MLRAITFILEFSPSWAPCFDLILIWYLWGKQTMTWFLISILWSISFWNLHALLHSHANFTIWTSVLADWNSFQLLIQMDVLNGFSVFSIKFVMRRSCILHNCCSVFYPLRNLTLIYTGFDIICCRNHLWLILWYTSTSFCQSFVCCSTFSNWSNNLLNYFFKHTFNLQRQKFVITSFFVWFCCLAGPA